MQFNRSTAAGRSGIARAAVLLGLFVALHASAADLVVVTSGGFAEAFKTLATRYESLGPDRRVQRVYGPSMGTTPGAVPVRLARGEALDVVIMVEPALDDLMSQGKLLPGSKVRLALSKIACAVPSGSPRPTLATEEDVRRAFVTATSVAWSDSASGTYIQHGLLRRLGIEEAMRDKGRQIPATPVGEILARHEASFGCQQRSELQPIAGIEIVGDLPDSLQLTTPYAAAVVATSTQASDARAFIAFLVDPTSRPVIRATGLEAVSP